MEKRVPGETAEESGPVIMQQLMGNHAALHPKQDPDKNYPGSWRDSKRPWTKLYERSRQVFAKTDPAQYPSTSKRYSTVWIVMSSGGSYSTRASPPQVYFHHIATVQQLQLPSHTRQEVDGHIPGTDRCLSRLLTVADHLPSGS